MIPQEEINTLNKTLGVPLIHIEKDYVMGWLLWGLAKDPALHQDLILKGGSALRKLYFSDTRFSDDLDFTTRHQLQTDYFHKRLGDLQAKVGEATGITFELDRTRVKEKQTPDPDMHALDARIYFHGFAGDNSLTFRIKFDVSPYERVILPVQEHRVIHDFSDADACSTTVFGYSLEEILAEKLRSWIQRTRARDLFDVVKIIQSDQILVSKRNILSVFLQKTLFKDIPTVGRDELLEPDKFETVKKSWLTTIVCPTTAIIIAVNAITIFTEFIHALFQPEVLSAIRVGVMPRAGFTRRIPSAIREAIIAAGQARKLIRMRYHNKDRTIEPYSFRYKIRKKDGQGFEYFFGYDRTYDQSIKRFFLHEIQSVSILPEEYQPRFVIEF